MSTGVHLLTAEEFAALPGSRHQELVRGEVVELMPPGGIHGKLAYRICKLLDQWVDQDNSGEIGVEAGFILSRDPDVVRNPNAYYVQAAHIPASGVPEGFWPIAPDLAVEVVSPNDTADEVEAKVFEYLAAGTGAVWVVYPRSRRVTVHTPDGLARTYAPGATLEMPALLPGFRLDLRELFG